MKDDPEALIHLKDRALSATAEGITIADVRQKDQPIIYANAAFERLTGYSPDFVLGRNCRFLQGPETDPRTREAIRRAVRSGEPCTVEILNYRKDGTYVLEPPVDHPGQGRRRRGDPLHRCPVGRDRPPAGRGRPPGHPGRAPACAGGAPEGHRSRRPCPARGAAPGSRPAVKGFHAAWEFLPCTGLAGDFLNVLPLDDRRVGLYVLDVSGHGASAALLSVSLGRSMSATRGQSCLFEADPDTPDEFGITPPARVIRFLNAAEHRRRRSDPVLHHGVRHPRRAGPGAPLRGRGPPRPPRRSPGKGSRSGTTAPASRSASWQTRPSRRGASSSSQETASTSSPTG